MSQASRRVEDTTAALVGSKDRGEEGQAPSPRQAEVLRGSHATSDIGSSDIRVWSEIDSKRFGCVLFLQSGSSSAEYIRKNVHTVVSFVPRIPLLGAVLLNLLIALRFSRERFDLIVYTPRTWLAAALLRRLRGPVKLILDVRSGPTHESALLRLLERAELRLCLTFSRAHGLTFLNERTQASVMPESPRDVPAGIWGSGVDLDLFAPSEARRGEVRRRYALGDAKVVMYHGSITLDRGIPELIRAVELLRERGVDVKLLLLGWGPDLARLENRFRHLLDLNVLLTERPVEYERVPAFVDACDVGALPFPRDPKWNTQMPLKLLEYLAMGKMVVATDLEAHRGFGEAVFLAPDNDPEILAGELDALLRLPASQREARARDSFTHVQAFSWKNQARVLQDFIERVMGA